MTFPAAALILVELPPPRSLIIITRCAGSAGSLGEGVPIRISLAVICKLLSVTFRLVRISSVTPGQM